ncbi:hypothetical protein ACWATR_19890 [Nostoc sp. UIC 10890]
MPPSIKEVMIYFSPNYFYANIQDFSGLLNSDLFATEVEILMLLIAVRYDVELSRKRCLQWATSTL